MMDLRETIELKSLLLDVEQFPWNEHVYMSNEGKWSLNSSCYIFNLNELADDEEEPKFAVENNLRCVLSIGDIQDVVINMKQQKENCSEQDLFNAFMYYYENDAFFVYEDK